MGAYFVLFLTSPFVLSFSLAICLCFGSSLHLGSGIGSRVGFLFLFQFGSAFSLGLFGLVRNMSFMFYGCFFPGDGGPLCGLFCFFLLRIFLDLFGEMVLGLGLRFSVFFLSST